MPVRPPETETVWLPAVAYVCSWLPETPVLSVPSPQFMFISVPTNGKVMVWLAATVCQVVTNRPGSAASCCWVSNSLFSISAAATCKSPYLSRRARPPAMPDDVLDASRGAPAAVAPGPVRSSVLTPWPADTTAAG